MPGTWKRKRILSEGIDFKQLGNAILGKLLNILHQKMYGVNWCVNTTILAISQCFPKCSDFNIYTEKLKQKSVMHQWKTKERVRLIL